MNTGQKPTVLIVDDDETLAKVVAFDLRRKGYETLLARNGAEAFQLVRTRPVDIVISDVRMPGGDGISLLERVKAANPELPIFVFVTGFTDLSIEDAYDRGAEAVFSKPFDRKEFFESIRRAMLPKAERWVAAAKGSGAPSSAGLRRDFSSLEAARREKSLLLGRGGMFLAIDRPQPPLHSRISFHLSFDGQDDPGCIRGEGIVRWARSHPVEASPAGCGIEFIRLENGSLGGVLARIEAENVQAFIPKG